VPPSAEETRIVIHCRHGAPSACDLDERDVRGFTALASLASELKAEEVRVLLEAGANPAVVIDVAGNATVEAFVKRIIERTPAPGSADAVHAREIMKLLAGDPRTTLTRSLHDDLAADPSTWIVQAPDAKALLVEARDAFATLPTRPDAKPACERIEAPIGASMPFMPRLRMPR
jgi:hypothetical protein